VEALCGARRADAADADLSLHSERADSSLPVAVQRPLSLAIVAGIVAQDCSRGTARAKSVGRRPRS